MRVSSNACGDICDGGGGGGWGSLIYIMIMEDPSKGMTRFLQTNPTDPAAPAPPPSLLPFVNTQPPNSLKKKSIFKTIASNNYCQTNQPTNKPTKNVPEEQVANLVP